jgi:protein-serine/threonine kinase
VNWEDIRKMRAPFEPHLKDPLDTEYFPIEDIDQTDHTAAWQAQAAQLSEEHAAEMTLPFIGYTFRRYRGNDDE